MTAWRVYIEGTAETNFQDQEVDTVFYDDDCDAEYVRRGLIEHDGYDPSIKVEKQ